MKARGLYLPDGTFRAFSASSKPAFMEIATREAALGYRSLSYMPNPDPILRRMGKTTRIYDELMTDDHVGSCVDTMKTGVQSLEWEINRGRSKSRHAKEVAKVLQDLDIYTVIGQILDSDLYGWAVIEVIWDYVGEWIYPVALKLRPRDWFVFGKNGELLFRSKRFPQGEPVPPMKFLLARNDPSEENPYGIALLSRCFWPVTFKKGGLDFWSRLSEKYGFPYAFATVPDLTDEAKVEEVMDMLSSLVGDGVAVLGENMKAQFLEMKNAAGSHLLFNGLVEWGDKAISKVILGQTLTTDIGDTGSRAAATVHETQLGKRDSAREHRVTTTVNQLIKWTRDYNWAGAEAPEFKFYEDEDVNAGQATRDKILHEMGWDFSEDYMMRSYGFEKGDLIKRTTQAPGADPAEVQVEPEFAEGGEGITEFDELLEAAVLEMSDEDLEEEARQLTKPIFDLVDRAKTFKEAQKGLVKLFPALPTSAIERKIGAVMMVSEILAREKA